MFNPAYDEKKLQGSILFEDEHYITVYSNIPLRKIFQSNIKFYMVTSL